ncbi:uncharacterized protein MICPUCDRAFT_51389 [Micromonas pusilla CCMP1545]|uniref:Predicted protein n=1 Tax=Micromonas pusilla (strain CCMP1545) TaxID=564608 RepID=C1N1G0_MICPC|nr:uncharacterized protein MICPUCDRAFT_51389 [Micromonas pusilla CCMP1545]EEH54439.1 predicted protein [Micromonas pusilla CCMP1545]|eukprot:XP_003061809.1 predicted protein [Micromonas pusilla CCMP1545]
MSRLFSKKKKSGDEGAAEGAAVEGAVEGAEEGAEEGADAATEAAAPPPPTTPTPTPTPSASADEPVANLTLPTRLDGLAGTTLVGTIALEREPVGAAVVPLTDVVNAGETASHTTPFAWCTSFLKDFSRRHSSPALPFQRLTGKTFD